MDSREKRPKRQRKYLLHVVRRNNFLRGRAARRNDTEQISDEEPASSGAGEMEPIQESV